MKRPSARCTGVVVAPPPAFELTPVEPKASALPPIEHESLEAIRAGRLERKAAALALFEPSDIEVYSVQAAQVLGITINHAACILKQLEREGVLTSRLESSPTSGNGRRVYRRVA